MSDQYCDCWSAEPHLLEDHDKDCAYNECGLCHGCLSAATVLAAWDNQPQPEPEPVTVKEPPKLRRSEGTVKLWYPAPKSWGFITPDNGGPDAHLHYKDLRRENNPARIAVRGLRVSFDLEEQADGRYKARNVAPLKDQPDGINEAFFIETNVAFRRTATGKAC